MNYQQMHQDSLTYRRSKTAVSQAPHNKLGLADLGKVAPENVRASAFRHFSNLLQSFRNRYIDEWSTKRMAYERKKIASIAEKWNFVLPEWF